MKKPSIIRSGFGAAVAAAVFVFAFAAGAGHVFALTVGDGGMTGSVSIGGGAGVSATATTTTTMGASENGSATTSGQIGAVMDSDGNVLNINAANGGLDAQISSGNITDPSSISAIVGLSGNTDTLINSSADLTAYDNLVVRTRPAIRAITANSDGSVAVTYGQPAKFLGIFPASISATMNVNTGGSASVQYPWYGFLYAKNAADVQTAVTTAVNTQAAGMIQTGTQATVQQQAHMINAVTAAINAQVSGSANGTANANAAAAAAAAAAGTSTGTSGY